MDYRDFLKTPYWKAISLNVKRKSKFVCGECKEKGKHLNVHHKTYEHHGSEHKHLEDLECICEECHRKVHNIRVADCDTELYFPIDDLDEKSKHIFRVFWQCIQLDRDILLNFNPDA